MTKIKVDCLLKKFDTKGPDSPKQIDVMLQIDFNDIEATALFELGLMVEKGAPTVLFDMKIPADEKLKSHFESKIKSLGVTSGNEQVFVMLGFSTNMQFFDDRCYYNFTSIAGTKQRIDIEIGIPDEDQMTFEDLENPEKEKAPRGAKAIA